MAAPAALTLSVKECTLTTQCLLMKLELISPCPKCGHPVMDHESEAVKAARVHAELRQQQIADQVTKKRERGMGDGCSPCYSCETEEARNVRDDIWADFTYAGPKVVLPQQTAEMSEEADLQMAYKEWATPAGTVIHGKIVKATIEDMGKPFHPDVIIFDKNFESAAGIAAVIELEAPSKGSHPPDAESEEFKQLVGHLYAILRQSPPPRFVYGFLTNHRYLVFVKAQRTQDGVEYVRHYVGGFREDFLQWILNASPAELGLRRWEVTFAGQKHILKNYLGTGQHSIDFALELPNGNIVVKHFTRPEQAAKEREVCTMLKGVEGVTQLAMLQPDDLHFVAVTPKGLPFNNTDRQITNAHVRCLRDALLSMHAKNLAYSGIAPSNISYLDPSHALLSDWSNVTPGSAIPFYNDFLFLGIAVEALGGSIELQDFALQGERKREREDEEKQSDVGSRLS